MVAKSYQNLKILCDPYERNGRFYVTVLSLSGKEKEVRWYSEIEYARMYKEPIKDKTKDPYYKPQKILLGFIDDYITIFKGDIDDDDEWFSLSPARFCKWWGWYFPSDIPIPEDLPEGIEPIKLSWKKVGNEDGSLRPGPEVREAVDELICDPDESQFIGTKDERIEVTATVEKAIPIENQYGTSIIHVMRDENNNCFVWITSARHWEVGSTHHFKGTVKEHKIYRRVRQTVLTRCKEC